jgi:hypothetical protein
VLGGAIEGSAVDLAGAALAGHDEKEEGAQRGEARGGEEGEQRGDFLTDGDGGAIAPGGMAVFVPLPEVVIWRGEP